MKVEFSSIDQSGTFGCAMSLDGKTIRNAKHKMGWGDFSDDEIELLIGPAAFKQFQNGKFTFDVPKWKINVAQTGGIQDATPTGFQLRWQDDFLAA